MGSESRQPAATSGHVQLQEEGSNGWMLPSSQAKHQATPSHSAPWVPSSSPAGESRQLLRQTSPEVSHLLSVSPTGAHLGSTTLTAACWDLAPGQETIDKSHA